MPKITVIIPTYNERNNLELLAQKIFDLKIPDSRIMVVDDNSPDGTGKLAEELGKQYPITVLHRQKKEGLGRAYVEAFRNVLERDNPDFIIQMDADLSHDPAAIPLMLEKIKNCDLVLGSRYIRGGKVENWAFLRKFISRFGNLYARTILGLPYRDLTGGFKCFRRKVLENIDFSLLSSTGYNFQIETTYKAHKKGYKICEIPISFTERKIGNSKFNLGIILESFWKVLLLRFRS
ncbi:MAG: polyprenol monophosphomannose synthase [Patescibacteria group bacterium]